MGSRQRTLAQVRLLKNAHASQAFATKKAYKHSCTMQHPEIENALLVHSSPQRELRSEDPFKCPGVHFVLTQAGLLRARCQQTSSCCSITRCQGNSASLWTLRAVSVDSAPTDFWRRKLLGAEERSVMATTSPPPEGAMQLSCRKWCDTHST